MQQGAKFCTALLFLYHTSDWLNQQNLPKLLVAVYLFSLIDQLFFFRQKSLLNLNTTVIVYGAGTLENWKLLLSLFTTVVIGSNVFTQRKLSFKIDFKPFLFYKSAFQRLINSSSENATVLLWGKRIATEQQKMPQLLSGSLLNILT